MQLLIKIILAVFLFVGCVDLTSAQYCTPPLIFTTSDISDTSVILRWFTLNEPDSEYQIDVQARGIPPSSSPDFLANNADRDTVTGLSPQTAYTAYIRSVCMNDTSAWKQIEFFTALRNGTTCGLSLELRDNSCQNGAQRIPVFVKNYPDDSLGIHTKLKDIELIVEHTYPADLQLKLFNPSGREVVLSQYHGTLTDNFGDPFDSLCTRATVFSVTACSSIYDHQPPFIGSFQTDESIEILNDGSPVNGKWILEVCDRAPDDIGNLKYINLNFSQNTCPEPPVLSPIALADTIQRMSFTPMDVDSMLVLYSKDSIAPDSVDDDSFLAAYAMPMDSVIDLNGLDVMQDYYYWTFIYCKGSWIGPSCKSKFKTVPAPITHYSDWETEGICKNACDTICTIQDSFWNSNGVTWQSTSGSTPTPSTGPDEDVFYDGIYLFKESSSPQCRSDASILQSICLQKINANYHGVSFYSQLNGAQVGGLILRVSNDQWTSSDTLWMKKGNQGAAWMRHDVAFPDSLTSPFQVQFIAAGSQNAFGDIAIGDIALMGVEAVPLADQLVYPDKDRDGFGNGNIAIFYCGDLVPDSFSLSGEDCNDQDPAIHPAAVDTACNGKDENCDGFDNFGGASKLKITIDSIRSPTCPQNQNGLINISVQGGNAPFDIQWSTGDTSTLIDSLTSGIYEVTVSDDQQCQTSSRSIELESAQTVQFVFQILQHPSCPAPSTGTVCVKMSGGTPPYQIEWSNGESGDTATSLPADYFFVEVEDAAGCIYRSDSMKLLDDQPYDVEVISIKEISCPGSGDASLRALAADATPPLHYQWNTGDTTSLIEDLPPGIYQVSVTDDQYCTIVSDSVKVTSPDSMEITQLTVDPQRCAGISDGNIVAKVKGGAPPYSFRWLNPQGNIIDGDELNQVPPGYYKLTVADRNGCTIHRDSILIPAQAPISLDTLMIKNTKCPLSKDGRIEIEISGGASPYEIVWSDGKRQLKKRRNLSAGTYGLTVSDAFQCKQTFNNLKIEKGDSELSIALYVVDSLFCLKDDMARIEADVDSDSPPFRFNWSAGVEHQTLIPVDTLELLAAGTYQVTVTDGIGCVGTSSPVQIDSIAFITLDSIQLNPPRCFGDKNGRILVMASSNKPPVQYEWSNGKNAAIIDSLSAGNYQLMINDQSNCQARQFTFLLDQPDSLDVRIDTIRRGDSICFHLDSILGGTSPFSYKWLMNEKEIRSNNICIHPSARTSIYIDVNDANRCNRRQLVYESVSSIDNKLQSQISVFPNPFSERFYINNESGNQLNASILNMTGAVIRELKLDRGRNLIQLEKLPSGPYFLQIKSSNGHNYCLKIATF